jgi:hypothetical protein
MTHGGAADARPADDELPDGGVSTTEDSRLVQGRAGFSAWAARFYDIESAPDSATLVGAARSDFLARGQQTRHRPRRQPLHGCRGWAHQEAWAGTSTCVEYINVWA